MLSRKHRHLFSATILLLWNKCCKFIASIPISWSIYCVSSNPLLSFNNSLACASLIKTARLHHFEWIFCFKFEFIIKLPIVWYSIIDVVGLLMLIFLFNLFFLCCLTTHWPSIEGICLIWTLAWNFHPNYYCQIDYCSCWWTVISCPGKKTVLSLNLLSSSAIQIEGEFILQCVFL